MDNKILDCIETYLIENDWNYVNDQNKIFCGVNGKNASFKLYFYANEKTEHILILTTIDTKIPDDKKLLVAEYIARANYGLNMGGFELNMETGEVQYKVGMSVRNSILNMEMIEDMIDISVFTSDHYYIGLMEVLFAGKAPSDAIFETENKNEKIEENISQRQH